MKAIKIHEYKLKGKRNISARQPLLVGNRLIVLFIYDEKGRVFSRVICFDAGTFDIEWEYDYDFVINNIVLSPQQSLLLACMDGKIEELNLENGQLLHTIDLGLSRSGAVSNVANGQVVVAGVQGSKETVCVNLENREVVWRFDNGGHSYLPLIVENKVYQCTERQLNCLDLNSGTALWSHREETTYIFNPVAFHELILVGGHGLLNVYHANDGTLLHQIQTNVREGIQRIQTDGDRIYFGDTLGKYYCYQIEREKNGNAIAVNSKLIWEHETKGEIESVPAFLNSTVLFVNNDNKLINLDKETGVLNWKFNTKGEGRTSGVLVADEMIYVAVSKGQVYKLKEK